MLEVRVYIEGRYVCWEYDDEECEYSRASFEQLDREARVQILQRARDFFAAKYGTWFVESGFARTPDEAALLVNSVTLWNANEVEIETVANVSLHNKRQAMLFKLAFAEDIVADDDEEDD